MGLCFSLTLFAQNEYSLKFNLFDENEKIGTLKANAIKDKDDIYIYTSNLKLKFEYMFMEYLYDYNETVILKNGKLQSLQIHEKEDDKSKSVKAIRQGNLLVYENGTKVDLRIINLMPYNLQAKVYKDSVNKKFFETISFDTLTGEILRETNSIQPYKEYYKITTKDSKNVEDIKIINKNGLIIYMLNDLFEAKLEDEIAKDSI